MKKIIVACLTLAVISLTAMTSLSAGMFSIKTSLSPGDAMKTLTLSAAGGETLEISAEDIERRLGAEGGTLRGITFTTIPSPDNGAFILDGVEVEAFEYICREEIDRLCFIASEDAAAVSAVFVPDASDSAATCLNINVLPALNLPPSIEGASYDTIKNVSIKGFLNVNDPEEDSVSIQIIKKPSKGDVSFNGQSFSYEPFSNMIGTDRFTVCAYDSYGNYSAESSVEINIENTRAVFSYADMKSNPSNYAALKLQEKGVTTGRQVGNEWYFNPDSQLSRGDFLIMLLSAAGIEAKPAVNTGLPNDEGMPYWLKPYVKKAIEEKIISDKQPFAYYEIPIRAEAVLMADRASKISDVKQFSLTMNDADAIPDWALASYMNLGAYKMLDLHDGNAYPNRALTNSYAADLIWQLYKHKHR